MPIIHKHPRRRLPKHIVHRQNPQHAQKLRLVGAHALSQRLAGDPLSSSSSSSITMTMTTQLLKGVRNAEVNDGVEGLRLEIGHGQLQQLVRRGREHVLEGAEVRLQRLDELHFLVRGHVRRVVLGRGRVQLPVALERVALLEELVLEAGSVLLDGAQEGLEV